MNKLVLNTAINMSMIYTVLASTSAMLAWNVPVEGNTALTVFAFVFMVQGLFAFLPALLVSLGFAYVNGQD